MKELIEKEVRIKAVSCGSHYMQDQEIRTPDDAMILLASELAEVAVEKVMALFLTTKGRPICCQTVGIGGISQCYLSVQNIAKMALLVNAGCVILFHNHPSGCVEPSKEDINITRRVKEALSLLEITLQDHIIIGSSGDSFSFCASGLLYNNQENITCAAEE